MRVDVSGCELRPRIVRAGGVPVKVTYRFSCCRCGYASYYEADGGTYEKDKEVLAEKVALIFRTRGWVLGKKRLYDLCPACLPGEVGNHVATSNFTEGGVPRGLSFSIGEQSAMIKKGGRMGSDRPFRIESRGGRQPGSPAQIAANAVFSQSVGGSGAQPQPGGGEQPSFPESTLIPGPARGVEPAAGGLLSPSESVAARMAGEANVLTRYFNLFTDQLGKLGQFQEAQNRSNAEFLEIAARQLKATEQLITAISRIVPAIHESKTETLGGLRDLKEAMPARAIDAISTESLLSAQKFAEEVEGRLLQSLGFHQLVEGRNVADTPIAPELKHAAPVEVQAVSAAAPTVEAPNTEKRKRRTRSQMEAFRAEQERLRAAGLLRGRGRPRKDAQPVQGPGTLGTVEPVLAKPLTEAAVSADPLVQEPVSAISDGAAPSAQKDNSAKRGPKPKAKDPVKAEAKSEVTVPVVPEVEPSVAEEAAPVVSRGRGRPRKHPLPAAVSAAVEVEPVAAPEPEPVVKRGRGRPRKHPLPAEAAAPVTTAVQETLALASDEAPVAAPVKNVGSAAGRAVAEPAEKAVGRVGRPKKSTAPILTVDTPLPLDGIDFEAIEPSASVMLYSNPSVVNPSRFNTTIQMNRAFWDEAGLPATSRTPVFADFDGVVMKIAKRGSHRVKLNEVTPLGVSLQIANLGKLNLRSIRVAVVDGALLMKGEPIL